MRSSERGVAMITTLLVLMLMSALLVGFTTIVMSDQRYRFIDRDRGQTFYAASGAVEKLTADLGNLFLVNVAPTAAQVTALTATASKPSITGITFTSSNAPTALPASQLTTYHCKAPKTPSTTGANGYTITFCASAAGNPTVSDDPITISTGAYAGLISQQTPYQLDVTAKSSTGGEVHLVRTIESVAIPVFQFGVFSDVDLSFFAGPNFGFGGSVHTNGNLFLAQGGGATLTLANKVTAVKEVVRQRMANGVSIDTAPGHAGTVNMAKAPGSYRALLRTEGSVVDGPTSAQNEPTWHTTSLSSYNSWIRNSRTGAKTLNLPLIAVGGTNPDLVRRPAVNEDSANALLYGERLYGKASIRILLSDTAADITSLPTVTGTAPVLLDGDWNGAPPAGYGPVDATHPPIARSLGPLPVAATTTLATLAGATTITVNAMPAWFAKPQITLKNAAGANIVGPFPCTLWTETTFTGCTHAAVTVANQPIIYVSAGATAPALPGNMPGNGIPTRTLGADSAANANITLAAGQTTWAFAANTFFLNDVGAGGGRKSTVVTCTGANGLQFTGCTGVPAAVAGATVTTSYLSNQTTGTIGGYIKIDRQNADGTWTDVTTEILNYGIGGTNLAGTACNYVTNAILRIQRLRDNGGSASCPNPASLNSYEWWPNVLFDAREALQRDSNYPGAQNLTLGGVMYYVAIDAGNLAKWFTAAAPYNGGTGNLSRTDNGGFTVYFSDRRNNRNALNAETGEYGWEDFVNPTAVNGAPNTLLDAGEDVNGNGTLETYGGIPNYNGASGTVPPGAVAPLDVNARPTTPLLAGQGQVNRAILFRRALKLVNGATLAPTITGLTIASENPVYVQGNWNANGTFAGANAATAVIADAVTLLSDQQRTDAMSFAQPYVPVNRGATQSWYRLGIVAGKGPAFAQPAGTAADFGTDGGAHNFLRFLETGATQVNYLGSIATFFYNRQAVGTYKCCTTVYGAPTRNFAFDVNFLNPALLPPNTPVFRDMNAVGFSQELRPGK